MAAVGRHLALLPLHKCILVADTANFIAVFPQGTRAGSNCCSWAAQIGSPADTMGVDDIAFFNKLLDTLMSQLNIDTDRIYSTGISQGGFMSTQLACILSHRIAAVAPIASNLDSLKMRYCNPSRSVPTFIINGTADSIVPYLGGSVVVNGHPLTYFPSGVHAGYWANKNGCDLTPIVQNLPNVDLTDNSTVTRYTFDNCACSSQVILYQINGGGHTWPGVENRIYELIAGETNEDCTCQCGYLEFFQEVFARL